MRALFHHFPQAHIGYAHNKQDYYVVAFTFTCTAICLTLDGFAPQFLQWILAFFGWLFLAALLSRECELVRMQVIVAFSFATLGEYFASPYMQGYIYRFDNVPAYVPAGHGMVYLTAVILARSGLFLRYARSIAVLIIVSCGAWSLWGLTPFAQRPDYIGAILFAVYLGYLFKGKSPMIYLGAFFITTWLEIIGTSAGTWAWAAIDPASGLAQGNPPSGVAAWYCLVDAVAMAGAGPLLVAVHKIQQRFPVLKWR